MCAKFDIHDAVTAMQATEFVHELQEASIAHHAEEERRRVGDDQRSSVDALFWERQREQ